MKKIIVLRLASFILLSTVLFGCSAISERTKEMVGNPAPFTRITMLDGSYVPLVQYRGRSVVLGFWETSCNYSRPKIEELNDLARRMRGRNDIEFIALSIDPAEKMVELNEMIQYKNLDYLQHACSGNYVADETFRAFHLIALPTFIVIDPEGRVAAVGNNTDVVQRYLQSL